jgi:hypothetical protein
MTITQRTLMRLPLAKLHEMCKYWGLTYYSDDRIYTAKTDEHGNLSAHRIKQIYAYRLIQYNPCCTECLKSEFGQWRKT